MVGPLTGVKVLDLTHVMAGPVATLLLADMGADVIKLERPPEGDDSRFMAPPYQGDQSAAFLMVNRHKRGIVLDLKQPAGKDAFLRLAKEADVVVENFRPCALSKLGLDFDQVRLANPRLIWCAISGFGRSGPFAERAGYDLMAQAMSGLMSFTGEGLGRPPVKVGAPVGDISAGMLAAFAIASAIIERDRTGIGRLVETSIFESSLMLTYWQSAMTLATGSSPQPIGTAHPLDGPYQAFEVADGWIVVGGANQNNWLRLLSVLECAHLQNDERFSSNPARVKNLAALNEALNPIFKRRSKIEWTELLEKAGVPVSAILNMQQAHSHPQTIARRMVDTVHHSTLGPISTLGCAIKIDGEPVDLGLGAPTLGQHTNEVLQAVGYSPDEIAEMNDKGAIYCG